MLDLDVQSYRKHYWLSDICSKQRNEIDDGRAVLGGASWIVLEREEQYFHILRSLDRSDKAEDLLRGALKSLGASRLQMTLTR